MELVGDHMSGGGSVQRQLAEVTGVVEILGAALVRPNIAVAATS